MAILSIIAAVAENRAIGKAQQLLCHLPADLKHFKTLTTGHTIIMGRKTFESLPKGALPNRTNIVLTNRTDLRFENCRMVRSLEEALSAGGTDEELFVIGGASVYRQAIDLADRLYITHIRRTFPDADTFFPVVDPEQWRLVSEEPHDKAEGQPIAFDFRLYERKR